ncbi:MAG: hypothetical protein LBM64_01725 [Deltaproteobacteria bacterium]|jgi:hypothetical protein|nr:hypothetical protein [Deltaproteobacteria bacterium]
MAKPRRSWLNADYATVLCVCVCVCVCVAKIKPERSVAVIFVSMEMDIFIPYAIAPHHIEEYGKTHNMTPGGGQAVYRDICHTLSLKFKQFYLAKTRRPFTVIAQAIFHTRNLTRRSAAWLATRCMKL